MEDLIADLKNTQTPSDWLSRDSNRVDDYLNDHLCGFVVTNQLWADVITGIENVFHPKNLALINKNIPILVFSGSEDPVGGMGKGTTKLHNCLKDNECMSELYLVDGARHETLNETNRMTTYNYLFKFLKNNIKEHKLELKNKVSLVTGAGQGIGEGIAKVLASHGSKVMIVDLNGKSAKRVAKEINSSFPNSAEYFEADLTDSDAIKSMMEATLSSFTKLDCICNNAAASKGLGPVENYSPEEVQATLDLTFMSLWKCLQIEIQSLKEQSISASIVNISSNAAIRGYAYNSIYAASKAAVNNLTQSVAKEVARNGIRVNAVSPGTINTPGVRQYFEAEPKAKEMLEKSSLLRRIGKPEEIGELVSFLLSERSSFITGQVISVDGGSSIN